MKKNKNGVNGKNNIKWICLQVDGLVMAGRNSRVSLGGSGDGSLMASPPTVPAGETEARRSVLTQAEEAKLMRTLELGAVMTLLSGRRGRPERRTFQVFGEHLNPSSLILLCA